MRYVTLSRFERAVRALDGSRKGNGIPILIIFALIVFFQFASSAYNFIVRQTEAFSSQSAASGIVLTEAKVTRVAEQCRSTVTHPETGETRRVRGCSAADRMMARYGSGNVEVRRRYRYKVAYKTPSGPVERWLTRHEAGAEKLRVGERIEIRYDPAKPRKPVLDTDLKWLLMVPLVLISLLVTPIGLLLAWGFLSWLGRQNQQNQQDSNPAPDQQSIPAAAGRAEPVTDKLKRQVREKLGFPDRTKDMRYHRHETARPARAEPRRQTGSRSSTVQRQRGLTDLFS